MSEHPLELFSPGRRDELDAVVLETLAGLDLGVGHTRQIARGILKYDTTTWPEIEAMIRRAIGRLSRDGLVESEGFRGGVKYFRPTPEGRSALAGHLDLSEARRKVAR